MAGKIKVGGDMTKLMSVQAGATPTRRWPPSRSGQELAA